MGHSLNFMCKLERAPGVIQAFGFGAQAREEAVLEAKVLAAETGGAWK